MAESVQVERVRWAIPPEALAEWLKLAAVVDEIGADAVPHQRPRRMVAGADRS